MSAIILTQAEVDKMRANAAPYGATGWLTSPGNALEPVPLKDGTFMLPVEVLADPAHAATLAAFKSDAKVAVDLAKAPVRTVTSDEVQLNTLAEALVAAEVAIDVADVKPIDTKG